MVLNSFAKLNLYLSVLNKRKDNYHNLSTVFERISLSDKIILKLRDDRKVRIFCENPFVPRDKRNLCFKAAQLLQEKSGVSFGADIRIIKGIPVGAGLGGGSSNAASVLLGLNKLWKLDLPQNKLAGFAKLIGADVPFFIYGARFAKGTSRGDLIRPLKELGRLKLWHILIVPKIRVSTPLIYRKFDTFCGVQHPPFRAGKDYADFSINPEQTTVFRSRRQRIDEFQGLTQPKEGANILTLALKKRSLSSVSGLLFNSLQQVTSSLYPEVLKVKEALCDLGLEAILMSGSGPAVFGIVPSRKEALSGTKHLAQRNSDWRVFAVSTI